MRNEPIWPLVDEIIQINQDIVELTDEPHLLLKPNELESACDRPYSLWHYGEEDRIAYLATTLITGIARNHPFAQGNKRTAFVAAIVFFENNGWYLDHPDSEDFGPMIEAIILGEGSDDSLAEELDNYLVETLI